MTEYIPDPFKNYVMKGMKSETMDITPERIDFPELDTLPHDELLALCKRLACQCGLVARMSEDDIRQAFLDRMAHIGLTGKGADALAAMEKRMDRIEGKPMQRQQAMVAVADVNKPLPENDKKALEHYFKIKGMIKNA